MAMPVALGSWTAAPAIRIYEYKSNLRVFVSYIQPGLGEHRYGVGSKLYQGTVCAHPTPEDSIRHDPLNDTHRTSTYPHMTPSGKVIVERHDGEPAERMDREEERIQRRGGIAR